MNSKEIIMKHLKAYLSDIPRYQNALIKEKKHFHFDDYKTFIVIPESPPPKSRKVFMVKNKEVFLTHRKDFFKTFMADLYQKKVLHEWDADLFSKIYLNLHLGKNARTIAIQQKANRYQKKMGNMKWFPPKRSIEKGGIRFKFFAVDLQYNEVHKYNILVKEDGSIINSILPKAVLCPSISNLKNK